MTQFVKEIPGDRPVLIAGPTASGKSAMALAVAESGGGVIVNADASQVFDCWRVITARPSAAEEVRAPHRLYGHVAYDQPYSTGHWLRDVETLLRGPERVIIIGGTGLYFTALTEGLAEIPPTPPAVRTEADVMALPDLLAGLDDQTISRIDVQNRARVQRAWEVQRATGRGLATWQDDTAPPLLPLAQTFPIVLDAPKAWLTPRIEARFDQMLDQGALVEVEAMSDRYDPALPSCRAIGVPELQAYMAGGMTMDEARNRATIATRQYAKRQRTWFRRRFAAWRWISAAQD